MMTSDCCCGVQKSEKLKIYDRFQRLAHVEIDDTVIRPLSGGGLFVWPFVLGCSIAGLAPGVDLAAALIKTPNSTRHDNDSRKVSLDFWIIELCRSWWLSRGDGCHWPSIFLKTKDHRGLFSGRTTHALAGCGHEYVCFLDKCHFVYGSPWHGL